MPGQPFPFLENIIDYAGIFPPAALSSEESFKNFRAYENGPENWVMNSLAWSVERLPELASLVGDSEVLVAAIGRGSTDWESWQDARLADADSLNAFLERCPNAEIDTYESRLPVIEKIDTAIKALKKISDETTVVIELPWQEDLSDALVVMAESDYPIAKIRTGGLDEKAFPPAMKLAEILHQCVDLEVPFKLTAGLHEPIAHGHNHGFLNILLGVALAIRDDATAGEIETILNLSDSEDWKLTDGVSVRKFSADSEDLDGARAFFTSFGSCSIDEPLAGLAKLRSN